MHKCERNTKLTNCKIWIEREIWWHQLGPLALGLLKGFYVQSADCHDYGYRNQAASCGYGCAMLPPSYLSPEWRIQIANESWWLNSALSLLKRTRNDNNRSDSYIRRGQIKNTETPPSVLAVLTMNLSVSCSNKETNEQDGVLVLKKMDLIWPWPVAVRQDLFHSPFLLLVTSVSSSCFMAFQNWFPD